MALLSVAKVILEPKAELPSWITTLAAMIHAKTLWNLGDIAELQRSASRAAARWIAGSAGIGPDRTALAACRYWVGVRPSSIWRSCGARDRAASEHTSPTTSATIAIPIHQPSHWPGSWRLTIATGMPAVVKIRAEYTSHCIHHGASASLIHTSTV